MSFSTNVGNEHVEQSSKKSIPPPSVSFAIYIQNGMNQSNLFHSLIPQHMPFATELHSRHFPFFIRHFLFFKVALAHPPEHDIDTVPDASCIRMNVSHYNKPVEEFFSHSIIRTSKVFVCPTYIIHRYFLKWRLEKAALPSSPTTSATNVCDSAVSWRMSNVGSSLVIVRSSVIGMGAYCMSAGGQRGKEQPDDVNDAHDDISDKTEWTPLSRFTHGPICSYIGHACFVCSVFQCLRCLLFVLCNSNRKRRDRKSVV